MSQQRKLGPSTKNGTTCIRGWSTPYRNIIVSATAAEFFGDPTFTSIGFRNWTNALDKAKCRNDVL